MQQKIVLESIIEGCFLPGMLHPRQHCCHLISGDREIDRGQMPGYYWKKNVRNFVHSHHYWCQKCCQTNCQQRVVKHVNCPTSADGNVNKVIFHKYQQIIATGPRSHRLRGYLTTASGIIVNVLTIEPSACCAVCSEHEFYSKTYRGLNPGYIQKFLSFLSK